ncbi:phage major capsid protein [Clostridium botulinum]|uniref:phage major capsid protein n=1 Tax=Clostridium botulinum TaxID=1491 RepID=UPI000957A0C6|nr:phage major capsid protein [Clostridium botulinum]APU60736.1 phage major capsid protein, HK97 family [Clostridium botulinum]
MTKVQEIQAKIQEMKGEAKNLKTADDINAKIKEIEDLQAQLKIAEMEEVDEKKSVENKIKEGKMKNLSEEKDVNNMGNKVIYNGNLFTKAIADATLKARNKKGFIFNEGEQKAISEHVGEDGGFAVPEDIKTEINKRLRDTTDISNLVNFEKVYTRSGQRTYEKRKKQTELTNLDEYGKIQEVDYRQLERISFKLHDCAGLKTIPNDLLEFAGEGLKNFIIEWLVDKVRFTKNIKILYGAGGENEVQGIMTCKDIKVIDLSATATIKDFKKLINVDLPSYYKTSASWVTNQDGYNFLDCLEDKQGNSYLRPDPKNDEIDKLLRKNVVELPNEVLETKDGKIPVILGDLKSLYTYYSDGEYQLLSTNIGGGSFESNTTKTRLIYKMDGGIVDKDAVIIAYIPTTVVEKATK